MAATHGARRNGAIDPHYSSEQFTNSSVMNPLPVEKFLDWLDGSIFWRYLVLLKIASLTGGIYLRSNFIYLSVRYFPWPSFIARYQPEWFLLLPNITFHFILNYGLGAYSKLKRLGIDFWPLFWTYYYTYRDTPEFRQDYLEAWRQKYLAEEAKGLEVLRYITVFVDYGLCMEIPCSLLMTDAQLLGHIRSFYTLLRMDGGLLEALQTKTISRIDIVEVGDRALECLLADLAKLEEGPVAKSRVRSLQLGFYGPGGRPIFFFKKPERLEGTRIRDELINSKVMAKLHQQEFALNIVRTWDAYRISVIVLLPTGLSVLTSVVWSVVAVLKYGADVQTSTQTAFTIASYMVTAGSLLIALVAYLDSRTEESRT